MVMKDTKYKYKQDILNVLQETIQEMNFWIDKAYAELDGIKTSSEMYGVFYRPMHSKAKKMAFNEAEEVWWKGQKRIKEIGETAMGFKWIGSRGYGWLVGLPDYDNQHNRLMKLRDMYKRHGNKLLEQEKQKGGQDDTKGDTGEI